MAGERDKFRKMLDAKEREMMEADMMQQQLAEYQSCWTSSWPWTWRSALPQAAGGRGGEAEPAGA